MQSLADSFTSAGAWTIDKLSVAVAATSTADFTSSGFLKQYATVFAASTILTVLLWLVAVGKRAVRGVPFTRAFGEAIGLLWLAVVACAFTPLILYVVTAAVDSVTDVLTGDGSKSFFKDYAEGVRNSKGIGGGPIVQIILALVSALAAGVLWLELVIRTAALYVGAVLGTVVYAGLVDKDLWKHTRRWAGIMGAIILTKPVIMIVLGLASALSTTPEGEPDALSAVISGLAIIILSIVGSFMLYKFIPGVGDDIVASRRDLTSQLSKRGQVAPTPRSSSYGVGQGIAAHASRQPAMPPPPSSSSGSGPGGGISAHASRTPSSPPAPAPPGPRPGRGGPGGAVP
ncbi:hypothetical protein ACTVZO_42150 [Streptomyces sp. IBSNAI002]|uniref:hypothetical protein n=1 Tax=Streptomyces sp. IBSNAI002 TaxID=3457500 RepID=UPI003FD13BC5